MILRGEKFMLSKKYERFSKVSLWICLYYFLSNSYILLCWGPRFNNMFFLELLKMFLMFDLCTWHIYGIFAILSLVIKLVKIFKIPAIERKNQIINIILHLIFMSISLFQIFWIFKNGF